MRTSLNTINKLENEIQEFEHKESNWSLANINTLTLHFTHFCPLGQGRGYIPLPPHISKKKAVVNVKNEDDECFRYAILASIVKSNRVTDYNSNLHFSFEGLRYPPTSKDIELFERNNRIGINIYGLDQNNRVYPKRINTINCTQCIHLLYIQNDVTSHYCYISDLSRLVKSQRTAHKSKIVICDRCFTSYNDYITKDGRSAKERMAEHMFFCKQQRPVRMEFPQKEFIEFKNFKHEQEVPVVVYVDFEAILEPMQRCTDKYYDPLKPWNSKVQKHKPISFGMVVKSSIPELNMNLIIFTGENCVEEFMLQLKKLVEKVDKLYDENKPIEAIHNEEEMLENAKTCNICNRDFNEADIKVIDHNHLTSRIRGVCHQSCNLQYQLPNFIPVMAHNMSNYDSHFIVKHLGIDDGEILVIPSSREKYVSISKKFNGCKRYIRFLDTFKFMPKALDELVHNIKQNTDAMSSDEIMDMFPHIRAVFPGVNSNKLELLTRKGVFPYSYLTDIGKLNETNLPEKKHFFNALNNEDVKEEEYIFAEKIWNAFNIKNLQEYMELYLKTDVILLCEVFERFREECRKIYKLDPCWYYTVPGLSYDAMLKVTGIKLEILRDVDMITYIEAGIRGGLTQNITHYAKANNKYLENFNPDNPQNYILYIDANNLYGWSMEAKLPYGGFKWVEDVNSVNIYEIPEDSDYGYILQIDIDYPEDLHDFHNEYPLLPEKICPPGGKIPKLLANLNNKTNYIVHYKNLLQALKMGLKLKKIHRILEFKQKNWLAEYIKLNNDKRSIATNSFEKDFYKLMNNSVFGKTIENPRKRIDFKLVASQKELYKLVNKTSFKERIIFAENVVGVMLEKTTIVFDKPIYLGFTILELSKTLMFDFHYNVMKKFYNNNVKLLYTDTDSFVYDVTTNDIYEDILKMKHYFDTSNYPKTHPSYFEVNKQVLGKFKDETKGIPIEEFVALRPKLYSFRFNNKTINRAKGIKNTAVKQLEFEEFKRVLFEQDTIYSKFQTIQSKAHNIHTFEINKKSLSPFNDKRVTLSDNINTLAYGHTRCPSSNMQDNVTLEEE